MARALLLLAVLSLSSCASFPRERWPDPPPQHWVMISGQDFINGASYEK